MDQNSDLYLIRPKFCLYLYLCPGRLPDHCWIHSGCPGVYSGGGSGLAEWCATLALARGPDPPENCRPQVRDLGVSYCMRSLDDTTNERSKSVMPLPRVKIAQIRKLFLLHLFVACEIAWPQQMHTKLEMWANAQRDGRPAEYRWRPLLNAAVWLTPTTRVPCSNAAKTRAKQ